MAWRQIKVEQQRMLFISAYLEKKFSLATLCRQFDISRKCGYKWIKRYHDEGPLGLKDRPKAPLHQAYATSSELVKKILDVKYSWPKWGPKKIFGYLKYNQPNIPWPSATTIGNLLDKHGLTEKRKLRRRFAERNDPLQECNASNDVWCIDFKGWSLTHDQKKFDPFTLMDAYSRFLLCCQKLDLNDGEHVWAVFDRLFRQFGLPLRIRSDNGPPFATHGPGRLSRLSIKLIKAGIVPEWIDPGHPEQNGRHERMHLTLQQEGVDPTKDLESQIAGLEEFTNYYNFIRPHEALEQKSPGSIYKPSLRSWNGRLQSPEYPDKYKVGKVRCCGNMNWKGKVIYISRVFEGEPIGLLETENGTMQAYYGPIMLGTITKEYALEFPRRKGRERRKVANKYF